MDLTQTYDLEIGKQTKTEIMNKEGQMYDWAEKVVGNCNLTSEEKEWLNTYHQMVYERLSPALDEVEKEWLKFKTQAI